MAKHKRSDYTVTTDREPYILEVTNPENDKVSEVEFQDPNYWKWDVQHEWLSGKGGLEDHWFFLRSGFGKGFDEFYSEWKDAAGIELAELVKDIEQHFKSDEK